MIIIIKKTEENKMFNKKKINEIETKLNNIVDQFSELKIEYDQILEKLDNENFTADWDEYLKWKQMKDKIPDFEEMYRLKELKRLINEREKYENVKHAAIYSYYKWKLAQYSAGKNASREMIQYSNNEIVNTENKIQELIKDIRTQKNKKDLIGFFKLYGIDTNWIKP